MTHTEGFCDNAKERIKVKICHLYTILPNIKTSIVGFWEGL